MDNQEQKKYTTIIETETQEEAITPDPDIITMEKEDGKVYLYLGDMGSGNFVQYKIEQNKRGHFILIDSMDNFCGRIPAISILEAWRKGYILFYGTQQEADEFMDVIMNQCNFEENYYNNIAVMQSRMFLFATIALCGLALTQIIGKLIEHKKQ